MKKVLSLLMVLVTVMFLLASTAAAEEASGYTSKLAVSGNLATPGPTKEEIQAKWKEITTATTIYAEEPSVTAPHVAGKLTEEYLQSALTYLNFVRYVSRLPAVQMNETMNEDAQHGAVVLAAGNEFSHRPSRPADMDYDFYIRGYNATSTSNIGCGWGQNPLTCLQDSIQMYMDDEDSSNRTTVGHRRWLLNPTLLNVGFGFAQSEGHFWYTATKIFDTSGEDIDYDFISWPASGNFPAELFGGDIPWSITLNPQKYRKPDESKVKVTITRESDGKVWNLDSATGDVLDDFKPFLTVNNGGYGVSNCIIFRPDQLRYYEYTGVYTVEVSGIFDRNGNAETLCYQVDFFHAEGCLEHSYEAVVTEPTCISGGYTTHTCTVCGNSYMDGFTDPLPEHNYQAVVIEPDCLKGGYTVHTCTMCGASYTDSYTDPIEEHSYETAVREPTCTEGGYTIYSCTACGHYYIGDETEPLGHTPGEPVKENDYPGGYDYVTYCTVCYEEVSREFVKNDEPATVSGNLDIPSRTKDEIRAKWEEITSATTIYAEEPSVTAPHAAGKLTREYLQTGLTYLNFVRYVAKLPSVQTEDALNENAQYGAVVLAANDQLSHYPDRPEGMDYSFYLLGAEATSTSNISYRMGYDPLICLQDSIRGCMNDESMSNRATVGHRRWLLNPALLNVGFGFAQSRNGACYAVTKVFDRSGERFDYNFISWPASGSFPANDFEINAPWSVTLNPQKYSTPDIDQLKITITREADGKTWTLDGSARDVLSPEAPFLRVNTQGFGVPNCIIFYPGSEAIDDYEGVYTVEVSGIYDIRDHATWLRYQVEFFNVETAGTPGDINGDGAVNNKDVTRLFQHLSGWDVEVNEAALDINGDGSVNNKDVTRLFQYLSGWDVAIH